MFKDRFIVKFHSVASRAEQWKRRHPMLGLLVFPVLALYKVIVEYILGVELPAAVAPGKGFQLFHGVGLVVHPRSTLGKGITLRQNTTIGTKRLPDGTESAAPILGDHVNVGANSVIIGPVTIGAGVVVGAGAVVVKDVPAGAVVAGNPARQIGVTAPTGEVPP